MLWVPIQVSAASGAVSAGEVSLTTGTAVLLLVCSVMPKATWDPLCRMLSCTLTLQMVLVQWQSEPCNTAFLG